MSVIKMHTSINLKQLELNGYSLHRHHRGTACPNEEAACHDEKGKGERELVDSINTTD